MASPSENGIAASGNPISEPRAFSGNVDGSLANWPRSRRGVRAAAVRDRGRAFDLHWEGQGQLTDFQLNGAGSLKADGVALRLHLMRSASAAVTHEAKTLRLSGVLARSPARSPCRRRLRPHRMLSKSRH